MSSFAARFVGLSGLAIAAFASGAVVDPAPAGAHCGGHGGSCGATDIYMGAYCVGTDWVEQTDWFENSCSGTCYNGGQSGCCESPAACNDADCKPGGCGGACGYLYTTYRTDYGSYNCTEHG